MPLRFAVLGAGRIGQVHAGSLAHIDGARVAAVAETENVLRVKGFVPVDGKPMRLLVQAVGARVNHYFDRAWGPAEARLGRLVVIGEKGLRQDAIAAALAG